MDGRESWYPTRGKRQREVSVSSSLSSFYIYLYAFGKLSLVSMDPKIVPFGPPSRHFCMKEMFHLIHVVVSHEV